MRFLKYLEESIEDKGILKALFMAGTPGSGKSYVISKITSGSIQPRIVNTDKFVEFFGNGGNVNWEEYGDRIERLNKKQLLLYLDSLLPLWIDGTSSNPRSLLRRVGILKSIGYDVGLVWIETDIETAIERAKKRKREVPEDFIRKVYKEVSPLKQYYKSEFKYFKEINNNEGELNDVAVSKAFKQTSNFFTSPLENPLGLKLIDDMKQNRAKYINQLDPSMINKLKSDISIWYS